MTKKEAKEMLKDVLESVVYTIKTGYYDTHWNFDKMMDTLFPEEKKPPKIPHTDNDPDSI